MCKKEVLRLYLHGRGGFGMMTSGDWDAPTIGTLWSRRQQCSVEIHIAWDSAHVISDVVFKSKRNRRRCEIRFVLLIRPSIHRPAPSVCVCTSIDGCGLDIYIYNVCLSVNLHRGIIQTDINKYSTPTFLTGNALVVTAFWLLDMFVFYEAYKFKCFMSDWDVLPSKSVIRQSNS